MAVRRWAIMLREIIEKEVLVVKHAVQAIRERIHPTTVMKREAFVRSLDDLGQSPEDVERKAQHEQRPPSSAP
jgi:hypothetical protein